MDKTFHKSPLLLVAPVEQFLDIGIDGGKEKLSWSNVIILILVHLS